MDHLIKRYSSGVETRWRVPYDRGIKVQVGSCINELQTGIGPVWSPMPRPDGGTHRHRPSAANRPPGALRRSLRTPNRMFSVQ